MSLLQRSMVSTILLFIFSSQSVLAETYLLRLSNGKEILCGKKNQCIAAKSIYPRATLVKK
ncbi:MAG: hypothetical protein HRU20_24385 [Pseudomonadales bacterium]|nr:hypothetical protein [Pseudomonadales bacterium]